jgi:hypothetical protein
MAKAPHSWTLRPAKPTAPIVPPGLKESVQAQAQRLIKTELAPRIPAPRAHPQFSYLIGISTSWWRHYFYFVSTYRIPDPTAIPPTRDFKYARLEYVGRSRFNLAWMRHTGQWF